jgi:hypothetical protein
MDDTSKMKEKKWDSEALLSTAAVIKLRAYPSPPPRPKTFGTREPTPTQTTHIQQATHETKTKFSFFMQKGTQPDIFRRTHHTKPDPESMRMIFV